MDSLRRDIRGEEIDYLLLMSHLSAYSKPRDKITRLLRSGDLIRVKKGIYVFGEGRRRGLISPEVLANMIYGPSYISLEYALAHYGLIPEAVFAVTSMTTKKAKQFETPVGTFLYRHCPRQAFRLSLTLDKTSAGQNFLIATPEKALVDRLIQETPFQSDGDLLEYLTDGLRIEKEQLKTLRKGNLRALARAMDHPTVKRLYRVIRELS